MKSRLNCWSGSFAAAIVGLFLSSATHANLIVNGGFEEPIIVGEPGSSGSYEHRNGTELTGWNSFSSSRGIVHFNSLYQAGPSEGEQAVQIENAGDWISQDFTTIVGQAYQLSLDGWRYATASTLSTLSVTVGPISTTLEGPTDTWVNYMLNFTANSPITTLKFESLAGLNQFPQIDNVSVNSVPIPATVWLFGSGLIGLVGVARRKAA